MRNFSDWREEPNKDKPLNENTDATDALRQKLNSSSDYLKQAFGGTPYADKFTSQPPQNPPSNLSDLAKSLDSTVSRIEEQLANERAELDNKIHEDQEDHVDHVTPTDVNEEVESTDIYKLYRDREETFECNISVEGASLASAIARIIVDTNTINLIFYGKLYKDGRCLVPLQKMTMYPEGTRGQIRLEVIVDDTVFSPWESACIVEGAKKVTVDIKQKKQVSVNFGETNK
jgi:hypothetical protein